MKQEKNPKHPVGTGIGAAGGAATGAAVGSTAGPVGTVVGGVAGAAVGAVAGNRIAESIDPAAEDAYWRSHYADRPYVDRDVSYSEYAPAYRYGWESRKRHAGHAFEHVENELERGWEKAKGESKLAWAKAKHAVRDAWHRVERP